MASLEEVFIAVTRTQEHVKDIKDDVDEIKGTMNIMQACANEHSTEITAIQTRCHSRGAILKWVASAFGVALTGIIVYLVTTLLKGD